MNMYVCYVTLVVDLIVDVLHVVQWVLVPK